MLWLSMLVVARAWKRWTRLFRCHVKMCAICYSFVGGGPWRCQVTYFISHPCWRHLSDCAAGELRMLFLLQEIISLYSI